ncbi:SCO2400 family protein [Streptomyces griseosporeus]|uniref:SCO2400 family protein n=1 Tax=Streptomyces griseosporeus TaxID=1910 RepID=UPI00167CC98D|nr:hypothetical protein [Streptomyces griseosporeus]GHF75822.1 hypothetical protein GCM10018783_52280 [Streptomyces griseosporeus]
MDYCSTCRRHLNGALVCPGCGAYAPDIAPPVVTSPLGPESAAGTTTAGVLAAAPGPDALWDDDLAWEPPSRPVQDVPSAEVTAVAAARPGRAARRRQLARLKKHQRRAMVATAFALVGGGLSLATLDRHTAGPAQAATTPDDRAMGGAKDEVREEPALPDPTSPSTPRPPHSAPASGAHGSDEHASGTGIGGQQPVHAASVTEPRQVAPPATAPRTVVVSSPQRQTTGSTSEGDTSSRPSSSSGTSGTTGTTGTSGTATQPAPAPTTADTSGSSGTGADSQGTAPAPAATSPAQLCLLGLCLG